jgi:hypothetical protein
VIFEYVIAGNLGRFLAAVGAFYERAGFFGTVDLGVAVTGIQGGVSMTDIQTGFPRDRRYPQERFASTTRVLAGELVRDPSAVATDLLRTFLDGLVNMRFEPLLKTAT